MKKLFAGLVLTGVIAAGFAGAAAADETFIPKGFLYKPGDTRMPAINSWRYKIITEADRRESEIYTSKKQESDFEDYMIHNMRREQNAPRKGWRYY